MKSSYPAICAALIAASILGPLETSEGQIPRSPQAESGVSEDYRIGPEDALIIVVWKYQTLSRSVNVRPDGKISLPLITDIQAAGLTPSQLRDEIAKRLTAFMPPPVSPVLVFAATVRPGLVWPTSGRARPARYSLSPSLTLSSSSTHTAFVRCARREADVIFPLTPGMSAGYRCLPFTILGNYASDV